MEEKKYTILSIDDDPTYKDLYTAIFEPKGYRFVSAPDPYEGYEAIKRENPDVILLDIMMPERKGFFDGHGLLKELRKNPDYKDMPIVMISALGDSTDVKEGLKLGATDYLPKQEMTPDNLVKLIEKLLKKS